MLSELFDIAVVMRVLLIMIALVSISVAYAIGLDQKLVKWWYDRKKD